MGTRVYLGHLPRDVRERDVERFFKGFDTKEINIKEGYGFVEFYDSRDADDAVYDLDNKELLGERIRVEHARGGRDRDRGRRDNGSSRKYGPPVRTDYRVVVENLSSSASWQDLKDFMRKVGDVTYADIRDGEGVVEFSSKDDMKRAMRKLDDEDFKGRRIRIREDTRKRSRSPKRSTKRSKSRSRSRSRSKSPDRSRSRSPADSPKRSDDKRDDKDDKDDDRD
jgi:arginine/serine-rich splicing factor 4/5/6